MRRRQLLLLTCATLLAVAGNQAVADTTADPIYTRVETPLGAFVIRVDPSRAPITVANYLAYVDRKLLDNGTVYRIVTPANQPQNKGSIIEVVQWGMNNPDEDPPPLPAIAHETTARTGLKHLDGTISMARNEPGTAAAEFFICIGPQPSLDFAGTRNPDGQGFAAFGQVVVGMEVVRAIYGKGQPDNQYPKPPIAIQSVRRLSADEVKALPASAR